MIGSFKYARIEYERCFLLDDLPSDLGEEYHRITDTYISQTRMRLRRMEKPDGEFVVAKLGQKYREDGQSEFERTITSIYLNEEEYPVFAELAGEKIVKRRYRYLFEGQKYSVDVFEGNLKGLVLCDVEGESSEQIQSLTMPPFAAKEVTDENFFSGANLAKLSRDEFQVWIDDQD